MKYLTLFFSLSTILLSSGCATPPANMWKCTATDLKQDHWVQYSPTRGEAAFRVRDRCRGGYNSSTCVIRCIPPVARWHCIAIDKIGHVWYWNSTKKEVAIKNARKACVQNTTHGHCRVPRGNCSKTS